MSVPDLKAQRGDTIFVHYLGRYPGGKVFDTSMEKEARSAGLYNPARDYKPLQVVLGKGQVIQGFEEALTGMKVNEEKDVTIPPERAYGKTGEASNGRQDSTVQAENHQHQETLDSRRERNTGLR